MGTILNKILVLGTDGTKDISIECSGENCLHLGVYKAKAV